MARDYKTTSVKGALFREPMLNVLLCNPLHVKRLHKCFRCNSVSRGSRLHSPTLSEMRRQGDPMICRIRSRFFGGPGRERCDKSLTDRTNYLNFA